MAEAKAAPKAPKKVPRAARSKMVSVQFYRAISFEGAQSEKMYSFDKGDAAEIAEADVAHLFNEDGTSRYCEKK